MKKGEKENVFAHGPGHNFFPFRSTFYLGLHSPRQHDMINSTPREEWNAQGAAGKLGLIDSAIHACLGDFDPFVGAQAKKKEKKKKRRKRKKEKHRKRKKKEQNGDLLLTEGVVRTDSFWRISWQVPLSAASMLWC